MRGLRRSELLGLGLLMCLAVGTLTLHSHAQPGAPVRQDRPTATLSSQSQTLQDLVRSKDLGSLRRLLAGNAAPAGTLKPAGANLAMDVQQVVQVQSAGQSYVIVRVRTTGTAPLNINGQPLGPAPRGDLAYVFDEHGRVIGQAGEVPAPGAGGCDIIITTLGTREQAFLIVSTYKQRQTFTRESDVLLVGHNLRRLLRVSHAGNDLAYTDTAEQARLKGPLLWFYAPGATIEDLGTGADGQAYPSVLRWDAKAGRFRGPSEIIRKDHPAYKIDLSASPAFDATDRSDPAVQPDIPVQRPSGCDSVP